MSPNHSKSDTILTRPAQEADIESLAEILAPDVSPNQMQDRWKEHTEGTRRVLVAEINGIVVGTISIGETKHYRTDSLRALSLNVAETHRRKGIATALIAYAESEAIRLRFKSIHHEVGTTNHEAIQLYESQGYKHINKTVMNQWWVFPDGLNRKMTEEVSWVMTKTLELPVV